MTPALALRARSLRKSISGSKKAMSPRSWGEKSPGKARQPLRPARGVTISSWMIEGGILIADVRGHLSRPPRMTCISDDRISICGDNRRAADRAPPARSVGGLPTLRICLGRLLWWRGGAVPRAPAAYFAANSYCNLGLIGAQIKSAKRRNAGIRRCYEARLTRVQMRNQRRRPYCNL